MVYAAVGALNHTSPDLAHAMQSVRQTPGVLHGLSYLGATIDNDLVCDEGVAVVARGYWLARQKLAQLMHACGVLPQWSLLDADVDQPRLAAGATRLAGLTAARSACTVQCYRSLVRIWASVDNRAEFCAVAARLANVSITQVELCSPGPNKPVVDASVLVPAMSVARQLQPAPVQVIVAYDLGVHCRLPAQARPLLWTAHSAPVPNNQDAETLAADAAKAPFDPLQAVADSESALAA
jgi:hypothetical protein